MNNLDFADDYPSTSWEKKPFLPDLHLKSALTVDTVEELGDLITKIQEHPGDDRINQYKNEFSRVIKEVSKMKGNEMTLIYGLDSVHQLPIFWDFRPVSINSGINSLLEENYEIFGKYLDVSKDMTEKIVNGMINTEETSTFITRILAGQKPETIQNLIVSGSEYLNTYKNLISNRLDKIQKDNGYISTNKIHDALSDSRIKILFKKVDRLMNLRNKMLKHQVKQRTSVSYYNLFQEKDTYFTDQFCLIVLDDLTCILLSYDQILLIVDTVSSRFLTLLFVNLYPNKLRSIYPGLNILEDFYKWGDRAVQELGNPGYNIIKKIEPFCIGVYLQRWDPLPDAGKFVEHLIRASSDREKPYLLELMKILNRCDNPNQLFELFGLYRHTGHPFVDESAGCIKMQETTRSCIEIEESSLKNCLGACKKHFIMNYIKHNKSWPKINLEKTHKILKSSVITGIEDEEKEAFLLFLNQKLLNINEYETSFPLHLWSSICFNKTFDYNDYEDFTPLLSDTAISPQRSKWGTLYNQKRLKVRVHKDTDYSRRTLINLLKRKRFSNGKVRKTIVERKVPKEWKIVSLHSKERELKIEARLFAMMVLEMRMYFATTEKNISDILFKYVPNQTMTNSEAELNNKLLNLTNLRIRQDKIAITFSLDMDKFNNRWRDASTLPFFQLLDDLYGTEELYSYSHKFFEESFFCLASYNHVPSYLKRDPNVDLNKLTIREKIEEDKKLNELRRQNFEKNSDTTWIGQGGGCEGLRQKGWTFIISSALSAAEEITNVKSHIIGQGDNQVIVALFTKIYPNMTDLDYVNQYSDHITHQIESYTSVLEKHINGLGMKLKLEETWVSMSLMNYGKEILINGCYLTSSLKRISRSYSEVNEVHPTLSTRISSIFSSCHSASSKSFDQVVPYVIASSLVLYTIDQEVKGRGISTFEIRDKSELQQRSQLSHTPLFSNQEAIILLNTNKEIGGYPIMPFTEYLFRGHPDQISTYLTNLCFASRSLGECKKVQIYISTKFDKLVDKINYQKLIQDPTSWNWKTANLDTGEISKILEQNLRKIVVNEDISKLLNQSNPIENKAVIDYLSNTTPFIPRVLNEIFRHSPEGAKLHYMSIFSDMKTMKEMMSSSDSKSLIKLIERSENRILHYVFTMIKNINNIRVEANTNENLRWLNSFSLSEEITTVQWQKNIEGSRIPHPGQQFEFCPVTESGCKMCEITEKDFKEHIVYIVDPDLIKNRINNRDLSLFHRGSFQPYTGSATKEKRSRSLINFPKGDRALQAAQNLFRIQDWVISKDSTLYQFILELIRSRTEIPLEVIKMASGKYYGGSVIHRFQDVVTKHACRPNTRPNLFSHIYVSSDNMGEFSGGKDNFYIHFQSVFLYGLSLINLINFWNSEFLTKAYHLHVVNYHSLKRIEESLITTAETEFPKVKSLKGSILLYSTIDEYTDKCSDLEIDISDLKDPKFNLESLESFGVVSVGVIIYSYMLDQSIPLIQSSTLVNLSDTIHCTLTLNDVKTFGISKIFQSSGVVWFLDNIREVLIFAHENIITLTESSEILIKRISPAILNFFKPLLCNDDIISEFKKLNWEPGSSQYPMNGQGLEKLIFNEMLKGINNFLCEKNPWNKLIPYKSITLNRSILLYFYSLIICSKIRSHIGKLRYIDGITRKFYELLNNQDLRCESLMIYYYNLVSEDKRLFSPNSSQKIQVSICGPESWVRMYKNRDVDETDNIDIKSCKDSISNFTKDDYDNIKYVISRLNDRLCFTIKQQDITCFIPNDSNINNLEDPGELEPPKSQKYRYTHFNRLTGLYSTAHYKYCELFKHINKKEFQVSINLAEGCGGLSKLCSQWFNCSKIIYNTLIQLRDFVSQRAVGYIPPEVRYIIENTSIKLLGIQECIQTGGNLLDDDVIEIFSNLIKKNVGLPSIMTMDAESLREDKEKNTRILMANVAKLFQLLPVDSYLIVKSFYKDEYLFNQICSFFFRNYNNTMVVKPRFSSSENTEIFLIIRKIRPVLILPFNESTLLINWGSKLYNRDHNSLNDDQLNITLHEKELLHKSMIKLGFKSNLRHCLNSVTDNFLNLERFFECPLKEVSSKIDLIIGYISYKMEKMGRDLKLKRVDKQYSLIKAKHFSESSDLKKLGYIIVNLYILKDLLISGNLETELITIPLDIRDKKSNLVLYTVRCDIQEWKDLYQMYFMRIIGHMDIGTLI
ncbi:RNA-dependent RNA polymerase [Lishi Spider Virus 2]|uniref:RNA-directed RNA polymerase L n=1 Tax=Lishi Spider Virus 2 TaxID=1608058 RepID=A0A0B5KRF3_9MONO|nr:RNA-dependent RNA polymerase [Lishi Spider Virus 2]AJG39111.1 RNA-dependent RNA polymerase [Lishi Spider Virus 2]